MPDTGRFQLALEEPSWGSVEPIRQDGVMHLGKQIKERAIIAERGNKKV